MASQIIWLDPNDISFPDTANAMQDPNGLLAAGGDLSTRRLLHAYQRGIFPWFSDGQPVLWWTPDPRMVLCPSEIYINRSLRKLAKKHPFSVTVNQCFDAVISLCSEPRTIEGQVETGTWITHEVMDAYRALHQAGFAQSIEAWQDGQLVGGLYGVALGKIFFGESMFSRVSGASKMAFATLAQQLQEWDYKLIDCQLDSHYLASFGSKNVSRNEFENSLREHIPLNVDELWLDGAYQPEDWCQNWTKPEYGFD
ncbi:MAG: leucyl/phenylalanyl-tRNA--protein transferase [Cellvibrionaceae bacterium]|nr:leucyl/phenylalanyl-tRNA--protein transferase [Cellvibrionaceae bacterium]